MTKELDPQELGDLLDALLPAGQYNIPDEVDDALAQAAMAVSKSEHPQLNADASARILERVQGANRELHNKPNPPAQKSRLIRFPIQALTRWVAALLIAFILLNNLAIPAMAASLPGDILYPVKKVLESVELQLASNEDQLADLYLVQAERRIEEAQVLLDRETVNTDLISTAIDNVSHATSLVDMDDSQPISIHKDIVVERIAGVINRVEEYSSTNELNTQFESIQSAQTSESIVAEPSSTPSDTPEPSATFTPEPSATFTNTPTATFTPEPTATYTEVPVQPQVLENLEATATFTASHTPEATATNVPTETPSFTPTYESYVGVISATGNVNVRLEPSSISEIVRVLIPGTVVSIIGESDDGEWLQIDINNEIQAWVASHLIVEGLVPNITAATSPSAIDVQSGDPSSHGGQNNNSNQGNDGINKFGCEGQGNSCNAPGQNKNKDKDKDK